MEIKPLNLSGAALIKSSIKGNSCGQLSRLFCERELAELLGSRHIVQINFSLTPAAHTVRGLHYQYPPHAEIKMIRCLKGGIYDVLVDIRANSPTFLQWIGVELQAGDMQMIFVPEGFAHGFQTLADDVELIYFHTSAYAPEHEGGFNPQDPGLSIAWPHPIFAMSERDGNQPFIQSDFRGVDL
ncbi:MAG: hypothetical protein CVV64_13020 [Candidatus Wallbacteria bacterium HGW-Wallbacteria-1]|jgi:dTDP-4-dehydrorhamnose 3,5-epimerase|uniref:dTDP-4-dehydrorhamnose 3,5-epimerase n=1 Tax=Candidatus Wallbacteria bacterium HGW-Wallbacteria-1 TaxID=2013854 RepID=A0A2N1PMY9_9BACT|nr:MAG: hypothetical protein CVV64_13020 [Candidatus Wallbacteria bacterium HGW-Wallbacteria-1]